MSVRIALTVVAGPDAGNHFELNAGEAVIGRGKGDFNLTDKKSSGRHCRIYIDDSKVFLEDMGSTNGTFLQGERISSATEVSNLDEILIGLSKISVAIIEELESPRTKSQQTPSTREARPPSLAAEPMPEDLAAQPQEENPFDGEGIRTTGVHRIEKLISEELAAFSQWDDPQMPDATVKAHSKVPQITVHLEVRKAPEGVTNIVCTKSSTTMGRKGVDARLNDLDCSRRHAAIEIIGGQKAFVRDLASTNGTFVNGKRISYQEVFTGDLIQVGQTVFEVRIESSQS